MQTPIDFGKDFLNRFYDLRDVDACRAMLAGDLVWITPEKMHHFLSEGAVLRFLRKQIEAEAESRYVDLISIKSSPSADNIMTVAYEINLVSREDERPLYLRCSMAICRRSKRFEITFIHISKKSERDSTEQLRDFITNLPCGVMILACLNGRREEAIYYNDYFAHRLKYRQEEFEKAVRRNPFFMAAEEDRDRIHEEIDRARKSGGSIAANMRFYRRDGNSFYYRMKGAPAYQANGGTVYYCVFQETTGYKLNEERLQGRLDAAAEVIRQIPEAVCVIEYAPGSTTLQSLTARGSGRKESGRKEPGENAPVRKEAGGSASVQKEAGGNASVRKEAGGNASVRKEAGGSASVRKEAEGSASAQTGTGDKEAPQRAFARRDRDAKVLFTSKNMPALFGISNTAFIRNILADPLFGLEITSITRERLLACPVFHPEKPDAGKPVSCGIFRLQKPEGEPPRVELVIRRVKDRDGTVRLYLFYYDREARQQEMERRLDQAMKMGRAGQEQLRAELRKAKEDNARRQAALKKEFQEEKARHQEEITHFEDQLREAQERSRILEGELKRERARRLLLEDQVKKGGRPVSERLQEGTSREEADMREKVFSPEDCLRSVLAHEERACREKGVLLSYICDGGLPERAFGFRSLLQRALCELIGQAIARTGPGGTVTVRSRADRPWGGFVNLYVQVDDTGAVIPEDQMQTLFEPNTETEAEGPARSDLFSAREAAALMGGSIHARSGLRGNSFFMTVTLHVEEKNRQ